MNKTILAAFITPLVRHPEKTERNREIKMYYCPDSSKCFGAPCISSTRIGSSRFVVSRSSRSSWIRDSPAKRRAEPTDPPAKKRAEPKKPSAGRASEAADGILGSALFSLGDLLFKVLVDKLTISSK